MKWFDNPKRRKRGRRKPPKGYRSWKAWMAHIRPGGKKKRRRRRRKAAHKRRRIIHSQQGGTMARRKRRRRASNRRRHRVRGHVVRRGRRRIRVRGHLSNPRRHRRYRRRHNPPRFSIGGVMRRAQSGAVDGLWIVGGKAVTNMIPSLLGLAPMGALGLAIKALSAVAAGYAFGMVSANAGKLATAAGFASIYEPFLKGLPIIGPALADDDYGAYLSSYPEDVASLGSYVEQGVGDEDVAMAGQY